jgi:hypothetical protein
VPRVALNQARKLMEVVKTTDVNGELTWTRPDNDAG